MCCGDRQYLYGRYGLEDLMNLLFDPIFRVQTNQDQLVLCLPALLERLGKKEIDHFVGLQKHQHDAFHVFLCYLAGAILARYGVRI